MLPVRGHVEFHGVGRDMVAVAGVSLGSNAISVFAARREATSAHPA